MMQCLRSSKDYCSLFVNTNSFFLLNSNNLSNSGVLNRLLINLLNIGSLQQTVKHILLIKLKKQLVGVLQRMRSDRCPESNLLCCVCSRKYVCP